MTDDNLSASPDAMSELIFEPLPLSYTNLAEMLTGTDSFLDSVREGGFVGHRDTFAIMKMHSPGHQAADLPAVFFARLVQFLDFDTYLTLRLTCRCWSAAISYLRPPHLPSVFFLPAEIIHQIYGHLSPVDYNAARHTCRFWMLVSLNARLLEGMLKRGGWLTAAREDAALHERCGFLGVNNEEWLLSKRLSTECSLRQDWTGTDTSGRLSQHSTSHFHLNGLRLQRNLLGQDKSTLNPKVGFSDQEHGETNATRSPDDFLFAISICSRYLLVADDSLIYVYALGDDWASFTGGNHDHIEAVATILCPHRVLAMSMDTSLSRFAVAVLLEGRVGLVCELQERSSMLENPSPEAYPLNATSSVIEGDQSSSGRSHSMSHISSEAFMYSPISSQSSWIRSDHSNPDPKPAARHAAANLVKIETRTIYRNLCSENDPPLTVAICPQRRCVAFGCSSGVELHWVDAITSQPMNRWFPLADPSDFLYFLPGTQGTDGKRRLRLVSSKANPSTYASVNRRCYSVVNRHWYGDHWWRDPAGWDELRIEKQCHHRYQTVPVADGRHVLFTDSLTGLVSLGYDAPEEEDGIGGTRLKRRFVLEGPLTVNQDGRSMTVAPRVYKAAMELRWGVRVVVGFANEEVWCFGVPGDWFFDNRVVGPDGAGEDWVHDHDHDHDHGDDDADNERVTIIAGVRLGVVSGLTDVGVWAGGGGVVVWGCGERKVVAWRVGDEERGWRFMGERLVGVDGEGDVVMGDGDGDGDGQAGGNDGEGMEDEGYFSEWD